jgi:hypothetical protein
MRQVHLGAFVNRIAWTALVGWCLLVLGCDSQRATPSAMTGEQLVASRDQTIATALHSDPFSPDAHGGVIANGWTNFAKKSGMKLGARLPASANGTLEVGLATKDEVANETRGEFVLGLHHQGWTNARVLMRVGSRRIVMSRLQPIFW